MSLNQPILQSATADLRAIAHQRAKVLRLTDEVGIVKDNLKIAKKELDVLLRDSCDRALNEQAGMQSLFKASPIED